MGTTIVQVDAFTDRPFAGNPAAVCVLDQPRDEAWMQAVAREMNLSETAFLHPEESEPGSYRLRWFTPSVEVDLCGHATLATAHTLWTEGHLTPGRTARFHTKCGLLTAELVNDWITLDLPATPATAAPDPTALEQAIGEPLNFAGFSQFDALVELASETAVRNFRPLIGNLMAIPVRGVIVTARGESPDVDFVSRFFAPRVGVDEDPVCGSAHCCLGPYWGEKLGKTDLSALQVSPRGGVLRISLRGDRVRLAGKAVTVMRGTLLYDEVDRDDEDGSP